MKRYKFVKSKEDLNSNGGNMLSAMVLNSANIKQVFNTQSSLKKQTFSEAEILTSLIALICNGRSDFCDMELFRNDKLFKNAYGLKKVPSESILRQRLEKMPIEHQNLLRKANLNLLKKQPLAPIKTGIMEFVPVDMDVSPFDNSGSKKEGVSMTYKKCEGFAPMFSYIGKQGYMLDNELRIGKQHCQKGTPAFLKRNLKMVKELGLSGKCLFRLDGGNDALVNREILSKEYFIIKRNMRKDMPEQWLDLAKSIGKKVESKEGYNVYVGEASHLCPGSDEDKENFPVIFRVTEGVMDEYGEPYLFPTIKVETWWTSLPLEAETVISLYNDHGTSEQYHSEIKTDLDMERLPSGKFRVNELVLLCGLLGFNVLRTLGQGVIANAAKAPVKIRVQRWRLSTVLKNIMYKATRLVRHARQRFLYFGRNEPWYDVIEAIGKAYS